jgi:uncharacterized protein YdaU (DUF1376 family)
MTRRPWFPLYVPDFLSKTGHLSGISSGAYLHLLMHQWMHESIPEDDAALARITRLSPYLWNKSKKEVLVFFEQGVNRRLNEELEKTKEISEKRSRAAMQMHLQVQSKRRHTNTNTNTNTNTEEESKCMSDSKKSDPTISNKSWFDDFWSAYPTDRIMSKKNTKTQWIRLSDEDRSAALSAVPAFKNYCKKNPTYRPVHAERFLSQRRFEGFQAGNVIDFDHKSYQKFCERMGIRPKERETT